MWPWTWCLTYAIMALPPWSLNCERRTFSAFSFARKRLPSVLRPSAKRPLRERLTKCINPRKLKVWGRLHSVIVTLLLRLAAKTQYRRLARLDFQVESRQSLRQFLTKAMRFILVLEAGDEVVAVAHQVRFAATCLLETPLEPQVQHVVEVDVASYCQEWCLPG